MYSTDVALFGYPKFPDIATLFGRRGIFRALRKLFGYRDTFRTSRQISDVAKTFGYRNTFRALRQISDTAKTFGIGRSLLEPADPSFTWASGRSLADVNLSSAL